MSSKSKGRFINAFQSIQMIGDYEGYEAGSPQQDSSGFTAPSEDAMDVSDLRFTKSNFVETKLDDGMEKEGNIPDSNVNSLYEGETLDSLDTFLNQELMSGSVQNSFSGDFEYDQVTDAPMLPTQTTLELEATNPGDELYNPLELDDDSGTERANEEEVGKISLANTDTHSAIVSPSNLAEIEKEGDSDPVSEKLNSDILMNDFVEPDDRHKVFQSESHDENEAVHDQNSSQITEEGKSLVVDEDDELLGTALAELEAEEAEAEKEQNKLKELMQKDKEKDAASKDANDKKKKKGKKKKKKTKGKDKDEKLADGTKKKKKKVKKKKKLATEGGEEKVKKKKEKKKEKKAKKELAAQEKNVEVTLSSKASNLNDASLKDASASVKHKKKKIKNHDSSAKDKESKSSKSKKSDDRPAKPEKDRDRGSRKDKEEVRRSKAERSSETKHDSADRGDRKRSHESQKESRRKRSRYDDDQPSRHAENTDRRSRHDDPQKRMRRDDDRSRHKSPTRSSVEYEVLVPEKPKEKHSKPSKRHRSPSPAKKSTPQTRTKSSSRRSDSKSPRSARKRSDDKENKKPPKHEVARQDSVKRQKHRASSSSESDSELRYLKTRKMEMIEMEKKLVAEQTVDYDVMKPYDSLIGISSSTDDSDLEMTNHRPLTSSKLKPATPEPVAVPIEASRQTVRSASKHKHVPVNTRQEVVEHISDFRGRSSPSSPENSDEGVDAIDISSSPIADQLVVAEEISSIIDASPSYSLPVTQTSYIQEETDKSIGVDAAIQKPDSPPVMKVDVSVTNTPASIQKYKKLRSVSKAREDGLYDSIFDEEQQPQLKVNLSTNATVNDEEKENLPVSTTTTFPENKVLDANLLSQLPTSANTSINKNVDVSGEPLGSMSPQSPDSTNPAVIEPDESPYNPEAASPLIASPSALALDNDEDDIDFTSTIYKKVVPFEDIMKSKVKHEARKHKRKDAKMHLDLEKDGGKKKKHDLVDYLVRQRQVEDEMKSVLKTYFKAREITKEEYKTILKKAVPQVTMSQSPIIPDKINSLMKKFVRKTKGQRQREEKIANKKKIKKQQEELQKLQMQTSAMYAQNFPQFPIRILNPNLPMPPI